VVVVSVSLSVVVTESTSTVIVIVVGIVTARVTVLAALSFPLPLALASSIRLLTILSVVITTVVVRVDLNESVVVATYVPDVMIAAPSNEATVVPVLVYVLATMLQASLDVEQVNPNPDGMGMQSWTCTRLGILPGGMRWYQCAAYSATAPVMLGLIVEVSLSVGVACVACVATAGVEHASNLSLENVTHWSQSVMATGSIPAGWTVVLHNLVVTALYTVWHPLLSSTILAVAPDAADAVGAAADAFDALVLDGLTTDVVVVDENVVVLPLGNRAVAFTRTGR